MAELNDSTPDQVHGDVRSKTDREELSNVCEPCKVGNNTQPAVGWCEACDELLCSDCYEGHCRQKLMRNHQLRSLEEMENRKKTSTIVFTCQKHGEKRLKHLCENHAELGCSQCFIDMHRSCSNVVCIADVAAVECDELKAMELRFCKLEHRIKRIDDEIEKNVRITRWQHDAAIAGIQEAGEKLKSLINTLVREQIAEADKAKNENIIRIDENRETNEEITRKLSTSRDLLDAEKDDNFRLFVTMKHLQRETTLLVSKLYDSERKSNIKEYEFVLNRKLAELLETVTELGTLMFVPQYLEKKEQI